jgi:hypothetical protein
MNVYIYISSSEIHFISESGISIPFSLYFSNGGYELQNSGIGYNILKEDELLREAHVQKSNLFLSVKNFISRGERDSGRTKAIDPSALFCKLSDCQPGITNVVFHV